jgi:hypothetical protein
MVTSTSSKKPAPKTESEVAKTPIPVKRIKRVKPVKADVIEQTVAKPAKKPKIVRDSFTIPKAEYAVLDDLKQRAQKLESPAKKSELLRAGIKALAGLTDADLVAALAAVPAIKTGRPKSPEKKE